MKISELFRHENPHVLVGNLFTLRIVLVGQSTGVLSRRLTRMLLVWPNHGFYPCQPGIGPTTTEAGIRKPSLLLGEEPCLIKVLPLFSILFASTPGTPKGKRELYDQRA